MIGIIGGYGNIGIEAADIIKTNSSEMIRVAGRNISKVSQRAKELFASDKWFQIKESSSNEWKDFIKGCRLVLCSAELGNETVECINRIAGELDCPIVYLGINLPKQEAEGKFIYGAGSIPGLSGIIPQYLAQDFDSVASIDFYYGAKGTFTYNAAKDYMDGVFNNSNRSMVMWKYEFEVVGLLANGSNRSKLCADFYHVPLYTQIEDIPEVDIACVVIRSRAVGGSGTDIAEYFLNKKVHVIQEQPIHPKDMEVCYRAAKKNHVLFQMGDLYPNLIEVENFIKCARYLNKKENPLYLRASFSPQVSYPANSVMKPGGILLIIETVEDVPDILITQSFMMTEPKDQRKATNTMFLNRKQWLEILEENGFCNSEEFPGYGEYLEVLGQKLFYCTKE